MIKYIRPEERYIQSYWEAFDVICQEDIYLATSEAFPLESTVEFVKAAIDKNIPFLFAIDTDIDRCIGWCDAMPKTETIGYLGTGLLAAYREQGFGKQLIKEVISLSEKYGYHQIELDVRSSNKRAIHVYEQLGFSISNIAKDGYTFKGNPVAEDVVQMTLNLSGR
ncbi:MAG: GNAT family N-acetyltransferase [Oscillospiraceae bacterium]|nr:GNAT family N-acetyltransferase [Oscillospiraceae bacterium]